MDGCMPACIACMRVWRGVEAERERERERENVFALFSPPPPPKKLTTREPASQPASQPTQKAQRKRICGQRSATTTTIECISSVLAWRLSRPRLPACLHWGEIELPRPAAASQKAQLSGSAQSIGLPLRFKARLSACTFCDPGCCPRLASPRLGHLVVFRRRRHPRHHSLPPSSPVVVFLFRSPFP